MIHYIATKGFLTTIGMFLGTAGEGLRHRVRVLSYDAWFRRKRLRPGTYVFSDLERLTPPQTEQAIHRWNTLRTLGDDAQLLNHPGRTMRRFELLRTLYEQGINDFDVYRLTDAREPRHYPVFIRGENEHGGWKTKLLHTRGELQGELDALLRAGRCRDDKIIVEFTEAADQRHVYHKYGAFVIGSRIVPAHLDFSRHWVTQGTEDDEEFCSKEYIAAEQEYVTENPHRCELERVAKLGRVDYGRIDYAVVNGQLRVFEINTNPVVLDLVDLNGKADFMPACRSFMEQFRSALFAIDREPESRRTATVHATHATAIRATSRRLRSILHGTLRGLGLLRFEAVVVRTCRRARRRLFPGAYPRR